MLPIDLKFCQSSNHLNVVLKMFFNLRSKAFLPQMNIFKGVSPFATSNTRMCSVSLSNNTFKHLSVYFTQEKWEPKLSRLTLSRLADVQRFPTMQSTKETSQLEEFSWCFCCGPVPPTSQRSLSTK